MTRAKLQTSASGIAASSTAARRPGVRARWASTIEERIAAYIVAKPLQLSATSTRARGSVSKVPSRASGTPKSGTRYEVAIAVIVRSTR